MSIHPKDTNAANPRLQCSVCWKWKRLRCEPYQSAGGYEANQTFFGGCAYTRGDHLAGDHSDVCDVCCHTECKRLAGCDCQNPTPPSGAAGISEDCPVHGLLWSTAPH